jgi:Mlc titration factor MtfA (ptsG expression regulator)
MNSWLKHLRRPRPAPALAEPHWRQLLRRAELVRRLDPAAQQQLRELCVRFLQHKSVSPAAGLVLDDQRRLLLAALCCLPVRTLGFDWLDGWHELIVYPGQFRVRREQLNEDTGVIESWDDDLAGEAWDRGPVVVSWADVRADLRDPGVGCNVLIHEIAHKLDALDGSMDGVPPLPAARRQRWIDVMQTAFEQLRAECRELEARTPPGDPLDTTIDAYAAESPDEFFAVVSEYHFSAPTLLRAGMPAVADELLAFYGRSPMEQRLPV